MSDAKAFLKFNNPLRIITKTAGLLPMLYSTREIAEELAIPESTLRDWLSRGAPYSRDEFKRLWIHGGQFAAWAKAQRKAKCIPHSASLMTPNTTDRIPNISRSCSIRACTPSKVSCTTSWISLLYAVLSPHTEDIMIERQNFLKVKLFLKCMEEVQQVSHTSLDHNRLYLRHLLLWADEHPFGESHAIYPTLPVYIASLPGKDAESTLEFITQKKIIDISKRFLLWAKATYPREFSKVPLTWIETLRPTRPQLAGDGLTFANEEEIVNIHDT